MASTVKPCGCIFESFEDGDIKYRQYLCIQHIREYYGMEQPAPDPTNPKDLLGEKKVSFTKLPAVAIAHAAHAMMNGAVKFGSYNWREKKVQAEIYIDAAMRHITAWNEREECASDSGVHHLGHAIACLAILLDAQETGNLVDNRPPSTGAYPKALARLNQKIAEGK